jgi:NADH-quinone oxidoreductase subunit F
MAGGMLEGRALKAVIPGGSSVPVVPAATMMAVNMDYDSLKAAGSSIGSAAVIVMDETTCMVRVLERLARFYMAESCGQCTPCREGTGWLNRTLKRILAGEARREDLGLLLDVANRIEGHTICGLGDAAAWPVQSFLKHFRSEFEYMIDNGGRSIVAAERATA